MYGSRRGGWSEAGIISVILQCKFKKFEFFRRGGSGPLAQCKRMTRWGNMCHFPIICIRIYISQRSNFKKKCFRHTKDPIDFSLTKKPPSQKFIENSTFNSLVNSRLIINSYKKGKKTKSHWCLSWNSNQRQLVLALPRSVQYQYKCIAKSVWTFFKTWWNCLSGVIFFYSLE